jgi:hypothetical protein
MRVSEHLVQSIAVAHLEAIPSKVIGQQLDNLRWEISIKHAAYLCIDKLGSKDIGEDQENLVLRIIDGWSSDVAINSADFLPLACSNMQDCRGD